VPQKNIDSWHPFDSEDIDLDSFFDTDNSSEKEQLNKIVLEYNDDDYNEIIEQISKYTGTKEKIIYDLLVNNKV